MPTIITHGIVGLTFANLFNSKLKQFKLYFFCFLISILPDFDVISFKLGVSYGDFFGHRGFFHSIFFSLIASLLITFIFFNKDLASLKEKTKLIVFLFIIGSSHGILDALTSGGLGIALLSPFENSRYFFPITPIEVSPINIKYFLTSRGVKVLKSEILTVWLPLFVVFVTSKLFSLLHRKFKKMS